MKNIKKIYFISDEEDRALVIYYDGKKYINVSVSIDTAKKILSNYAEENNYSSLQDLKYDGIYDVIKSKEIPNKIMNLMEEQTKKEEKNNELVDNDDIDENLGNKVNKIVNSISNMKIDKLKVKKYAITAGLILGGVLVADGIYNLGKYSGKRNSNITKSVGTTNITTEELIKENNMNFASIDDVIENADINDSKKEAVTSVWEYINFYNDTLSSAHLCSDGTRLSHSWDEIMSNYLVYNYISGEEAVQIFDDYDLDINELKASYSSSIEQAVMGYVVLTEPTSKDSLIKSDTGKNFYRKYEDMLIRFNQSGDDVGTKEQIAKEFYSDVYVDFLNGNNLSENETYKLSVIPIIKAFNLLTENIDCDIKLSEEDTVKINDMGNGMMVSTYLESISDYVNNNNDLVRLNDDITYTEITDIAIEELSDNNLYNIDESNRNITNSLEYKSMFKQSPDKEKPKSNKSNSNSNSYSGYNQSIANTAGEISEEEDTIPDWMIEDNNQENGYNNQNNEYDPSIDEDVPNVDSDTPDMSFFKSSYQNLDEQEKQNYYETIADRIIETMTNENTIVEDKIRTK